MKNLRIKGMKKHHHYLLLFLLVLLPILGTILYYNGNSNALAAGTNVYSNPGCESSTTGWNSWQGTVSRSTSSFRSGVASCLITYSTGTQYTVDDASDVSSPQYNTQWTGSVWVRTSSSSSVGKTVRLALRLDRGQTDQRIFYSTPVTLSGTWQQVTTTITIDTSTRTALDLHVVHDNATSGSSFFIDDMELYQETATAPTPTTPIPTATPVPTTSTPNPTATPAPTTPPTPRDPDSAPITTTTLLQGGHTVELISKEFTNKCARSFFNDVHGNVNFGSWVVTALCDSNPYGDLDVIRVNSTTVQLKYQKTCMEVAGAGTTNGTPVTFYPCWPISDPNSLAQTWQPYGNGVFRNTLSGKCLDATTGETNKQLVIWTCDGSLSQSWTINKIYDPPKITSIPTSSLLQGVHRVEIVSQQYPSQCIDTEFGFGIPGTRIQNYLCLNNNNQKYEIVPVTSTLVQIHFRRQCFDVNGAATTDGSTIILYPCRALSDPLSGAQTWQPMGNGVLRNTRSGRCLDATTGANGVSLQIWGCDGTPSQSWTFNRTGIPSLGGNINSLNFAISNNYPWMQIVCGDVRMDGGFNNNQPPGQSAIITNSSCNSPGIIYTGDSSANFGRGNGSSNNRVVGGTSYPEVHSNNGGNGVFSKHEKIKEKARSGDTPITDLSTVCTLSNCTLPVNLPKGIYQANGDVALNAYTFASNQDYVFIIDGNLTIKGNVLTPPASNTSTLFSSAGDINVLPNVGSTPPSNSPHVSGIFSADRSFIVQSSNDCNDLKFNFEGTMIVNADQNGGSLQNLRSLCGNNATSPTITMTQRLDFLFNLPEFLKVQRILSEEAAP